MRTQLQAISLRIQTVRSNEQMMQSMKGATMLLGSMNRQMNLPALQRIAMEFEKENDIMDQRQEMMDDAIDDVTGLEDEEEGEEVVREVLDEIGVDLGQAVRKSSFSRGESGGQERGFIPPPKNTKNPTPFLNQYTNTYPQKDGRHPLPTPKSARFRKPSRRSHWRRRRRWRNKRR